MPKKKKKEKRRKKVTAEKCLTSSVSEKCKICNECTTAWFSPIMLISGTYDDIKIRWVPIISAFEVSNSCIWQ